LKTHALLLLALSACSGGGGNPTTLLPSASTTTTSITDTTITESANRRIPQPTQTSGFEPVRSSYVLLQSVGGGSRTAGAFADPPQSGWALAFASNGNFLRALRRRERLPVLTTYELDVLTTTPNLQLYPTTPIAPNVPFEREGWILTGGRYDISGRGLAFTSPWAVHLKSVQAFPKGATISGADLPTPFFAWDNSNGSLLGEFLDQGNPNFTLTASVDSTVVFAAQGWPQSHCGNCWMVLQH
jgi:hypothetical protein